MLIRHDWVTVTTAWWRKYPNAKLAHVESSHTLERYIDRDGKLQITRLVTCFSPIPDWLEKISGIDGHTCFKEHIEIDPISKTFVAESKNLTCRSLSSSVEVCKYIVSPQSPNMTLFTQNATMEFFLPIISGKVEDFSEGRFQGNAKKGLEVMEDLCNKTFL